MVASMQQRLRLAFVLSLLIGVYQSTAFRIQQHTGKSSAETAQQFVPTVRHTKAGVGGGSVASDTKKPESPLSIPLPATAESEESEQTATDAKAEEADTTAADSKADEPEQTGAKSEEAKAPAADSKVEETEQPPTDSTTHPAFFTEEFQEVTVKENRQETHNSKLITFALPDGVSMGLPVSSAIVMNAAGIGKDGKDMAKPYNPISSNTELGSFGLLVKTYPEGKVSKFAYDLKVGDKVGFKQGKPQIKAWQYPFGKASITMLAGGTGIAPMIQALHPLLHTPGDTTKIRLLYGNEKPYDIMLKKELDEFQASYPDRFEVTYVVGKSADDKSAVEDGWKGETGWIDEEKVKRLAFPPSEDTVTWICGLDAMYDSLAGSRFKELAEGSALHNLGYTEDMVWRS
jgi:cytochrome-b5 reductase